MSPFYISSRSPSPTPSTHSPTNSTSSEDDLPYPAPLPRSAFLTPDFTPSTYLSSLRNRHQTLEDLRTDLRARSSLLSKELLDLVNGNYQDFLELGTALKSGEERVEEVRVGLLGFGREVEGVSGVVGEREEEVAALVSEREQVRREIEVGYALLRFEAALGRLEAGLLGAGNGRDGGSESDEEGSEGESEDDEEEDGRYSMALGKLRKHVRQYLLVQRGVTKVGAEHPFVVAQGHRMVKVRNTIVLDLNTALQQARAAGAAGQDRSLRIMKMYADLGEEGEAVRVLRAFKALT